MPPKTAEQIRARRLLPEPAVLAQGLTLAEYLRVDTTYAWIQTATQEERHDDSHRRAGSPPGGGLRTLSHEGGYLQGSRATWHLHDHPDRRRRRIPEDNGLDTTMTNRGIEAVNFASLYVAALGILALATLVYMSD